MKYLYHGTRYLPQILKSNCIKKAEFGDEHVSLSWDKDEARCWAEIPRDDDAGNGWIIAIDRIALVKAGYDLKLFHSSNANRDEQEIACMSDINNLSDYIVEINLLDTE
jgi:hypothetical protein